MEAVSSVHYDLIEELALLTYVLGVACKSILLHSFNNRFIVKLCVHSSKVFLTDICELDHLFYHLVPFTRTPTYV